MAKNGTSNNKYAFIDYYLLDNLDKNMSNIIDKVEPIIGILLPKRSNYDETKIMESIETINNNNQFNDIKRQLKSSLNNYNIQLLDTKGENYDKRYGIVSANNNFSNNNFQQQNVYNNNNNINKSGFYYNQNYNNGMFNQNKLQNTGNLIVNNNNFNNYNYINQNSSKYINNNQVYNNFNQINKSINLNSSPNYGNNFIIIQDFLSNRV